MKTEVITYQTLADSIKSWVDRKDDKVYKGWYFDRRRSSSTWSKKIFFDQLMSVSLSCEGEGENGVVTGTTQTKEDV